VQDPNIAANTTPDPYIIAYSMPDPFIVVYTTLDAALYSAGNITSFSATNDIGGLG
jgi:hypothetical protein